MQIGFVGLGNMGSRLASRLTTAGDLRVYARREVATAPFRERATVCPTITDIAVGADVVGVCVATDAQVLECVGQLVPVMPPGSVLMIHSTVSPETVRAAGRLAGAAGVAVVDAPVTVTRIASYLDDPHGVDPFVLMMLGGEPEAIERVLPCLDACCTETVRCSTLGSAMSLKIINNLVTHVETVVAEEAFRIAVRSSIPVEALETVLARNGVLTPVMKRITDRIGEPAPDPAEERVRAIHASNGVKDLLLAEQLAADAQTSSATATFARNQFWFAATAAGPRPEENR